MTKVISFSLWGNISKYCVGAIRNAELAQEFYPGWECWFFTDRVARDQVRGVLGAMDHVRIFDILHTDWRGMFDRFFPITFDEGDEFGVVDTMIVRDCDSRLSAREAAAVEQWMLSGKMFHTMHDHFHHSVPILGGLWGMKRGCLPNFGRLLAEWPAENKWQTDQEFLAAKVWPLVQHTTMNHAEFHLDRWPGLHFPLPRQGQEFVGATYDENDIIDADQVRRLNG